MGTNAELHDQDFYAWLEDTASLLRVGKWHDIDATALAEELDAARSQERREALRRLRQLMQHLLQWQYQPARRQTGRSWRSTIQTQRAALADMLDESPSMAREFATLLTKRAIRSLGSGPATTPACPWLPFRLPARGM